MRLLDIYEEAIEIAGISPDSLTSQHLASARRTYKLMLMSQTAADSPLFTLGDKTVSLTTGQSSFLLLPNELDVVEAYIQDHGQYDRPVHIMGYQEWMDIPDKTLRGQTDRLYVDREVQESKQHVVNIWQRPHDDSMKFKLKVINYINDVGSWGDDPRVPDYWMNVLVWDLAKRLAFKWAPERINAINTMKKDEKRGGRAADSPQSDVSFRLTHRGRGAYRR